MPRVSGVSRLSLNDAALRPPGSWAAGAASERTDCDDTPRKSAASDEEGAAGRERRGLGAGGGTTNDPSCGCGWVLPAGETGPRPDRPKGRRHAHWSVAPASSRRSARPRGRSRREPRPFAALSTSCVQRRGRAGGGHRGAMFACGTKQTRSSFPRAWTRYEDWIPQHRVAQRVPGRDGGWPPGGKD